MRSSYIKRLGGLLLCCVVVCIAAAPVLAGKEDWLTEVPLDLLEPPSEGKAVVYFFMPGKTPLIPSVALFDTGKQLPILLGAREYFRYETDPGIHSFSVGANVSFGLEISQWLRADLEAGGIYAAFVSNYLADLVIHPMPTDMERLVNLKKGGEQWKNVAGLIKAKPPKPPGKERKHTSHVEGAERIYPRWSFRTLERLNAPSKERTVDVAPVDRLPAPVPGKSLVVFFLPEKRPDQSVTVFDGMQKLGPNLEGGKYYTYETTPGARDLWVGEVKVAWTIYRLVKADLQPGKVYGIYLFHSLGAAGARMFGLSGDMENELYDMAEWEAWMDIDQLWDSPGGALIPAGAAASEGKETKEIQKWLKKKSKKKHTGVTALR